MDKKYFVEFLQRCFLLKKIGDLAPKCVKEGVDNYKRTLAECFIDGESLSVFLVGSGYAFAYRKYRCGCA